jgi:hypothetical protein
MENLSAMPLRGARMLRIIKRCFPYQLMWSCNQMDQFSKTRAIDFNRVLIVINAISSWKMTENVWEYVIRTPLLLHRVSFTLLTSL